MRLENLSYSINLRAVKHKLMVPVVLFIGVVLLGLPWTAFTDWLQTPQIQGIPLGYFFAFLLFPILLVFFLRWYVNLQADIDRHDPETENE